MAFRIKKLRIERKGVLRTIFELNGDKLFEQNGQQHVCNQIVFTESENAELKSVLLTFFEGDKLFDYEIRTYEGNHRCTIDAIERYR